MTRDGYDVAIVGGSTGGCTAAILFAREGARVALIERKPDPAAYKTVCTHFIQRSAMGTLDRLGIAEPLRAAGAEPNELELSIDGIGHVGAFGEEAPGLNVRRKVLDPMLRELAIGTQGVDALLGTTVTGLTGDGRPDGVTVRGPSGDGAVHAKLVVGADGRGSKVARWAGVPGRVRPHGRFFYYGYYRGLDWPQWPLSRMWIRGRDGAYVFPNDDGVAVVLVAPHRDRLPEFKADTEGAFARMVGALPGGPDLSGGERDGPLIGKLDLPNVMRPAARPGVAFVGDAALASDPFWGIGCGWAFQSAEWLVDATAGALTAGDPAQLDAGLERYRRTHRRRLGPHHFLIADFASGRPLNGFERILWKASARDPKFAAITEKIGTRSVHPALLFRPDVMGRMLVSGLRPGAVAR